MSTAYDPIDGTIEVPIPYLKKSEYLPAQLHVSRFFGGTVRGVSIQLSIDGNDDWSDIQLDNESAHKLLEVLLDALGHVGANEQ